MKSTFHFNSDLQSAHPPARIYQITLIPFIRVSITGKSDQTSTRARFNGTSRHTRPLLHRQRRRFSFFIRCFSLTVSPSTRINPPRPPQTCTRGKKCSLQVPVHHACAGNSEQTVVSTAVAKRCGESRTTRDREDDTYGYLLL